MNETSELPSSPNTEPQPQMVRIAMPSLAPSVTYVIMGFTILVYILQMLSVGIYGSSPSGGDLLEVYFARANGPIQAGEWWRLITPVFLHGSIAHIFFNMYALLSVGSLLERHFGHGRFALMYFLGAFAGNVMSFLFAREGSFSVGASTAVFGLIAAEYVFFYQNRKLFGNYARQAMGNTIFIIVINLAIGSSISGIDNWGHIGGLVGGAMFAWFAGPRWDVEGLPPEVHLKDRRESSSVVLGAALVLVTFSALAALKLFS
jgi:rhomboid protease GluP